MKNIKKKVLKELLEDDKYNYSETPREDAIDLTLAEVGKVIDDFVLSYRFTEILDLYWVKKKIQHHEMRKMIFEELKKELKI
ncbi:hypothetical protein LCGC14_0953790 [marine sediment metagenome]|uniref:Uncharacterized protein n=1 Tax=marine sediment metagenome TaxID=412755 RepID=A0A0F9NL05_9ZZZZ